MLAAHSSWARSMALEIDLARLPGTGVGVHAHDLLVVAGAQQLDQCGVLPVPAVGHVDVQVAGVVEAEELLEQVAEPGPRQPLVLLGQRLRVARVRDPHAQADVEERQQHADRADVEPAHGGRHGRPRHPDGHHRREPRGQRRLQRVHVRRRALVALPPAVLVERGVHPDVLGRERHAQCRDPVVGADLPPGDRRRRTDRQRRPGRFAVVADVSCAEPDSTGSMYSSGGGWLLLT